MTCDAGQRPDLAARRGRPARQAMWQPGRDRFPARPAASSWPATAWQRSEVTGELAGPRFVLPLAGSQRARDRGIGLLLDWLEDLPGQTWQERWLGSGADRLGSGWRAVPAGWLAHHGHQAHQARWRLAGLSAALTVAIAADIIRPSPDWFVAGGTARGHLVPVMSAARDPAVARRSRWASLRHSRRA